MNDDLDRLLEKANELENEEENTIVNNEPVSNETENKNEDNSNYFGGEFTKEISFQLIILLMKLKHHFLTIQ